MTMAQTPQNEPDPDLRDMNDLRRLEQHRSAKRPVSSRAAWIGLVIVVVIVLGIVWLLTG